MILDTKRKLNFLVIFRMHLNISISFFLRWEDDHKHEVCRGSDSVSALYFISFLTFVLLSFFFSEKLLLFGFFAFFAFLPFY